MPDGWAKKERRFLAEILYGFITATICAWQKCISRQATFLHHHDMASFAQAIRRHCEPIHGQPAETISMGKLLTRCSSRLTELFDMETRPELVMLQKTIGVRRRRRLTYPQSALQHVEGRRPRRQRLDPR